MQSCRASSPTDAQFTAANASNLVTGGIATTSPLSVNTEYDLTCQTLGGQTKSASTTIAVSTSTPAALDITVSSSADSTTINHGATVTINWQTPNAASNSAVSLWLINVESQQAVALIAGQQSTSGSFTWNVPAIGTACDTNSLNACATDLVAGQEYVIEAALYTPQNAFLGGLPVPTNAIDPSYTDFGYTNNVFTLGN